MLKRFALLIDGNACRIETIFSRRPADMRGGYLYSYLHERFVAKGGKGTVL